MYDATTCLSVEQDVDIIIARKLSRDLASRAVLPGSALAFIASPVSEVAAIVVAIGQQGESW